MIAHKLKYFPIINIICILPSTVNRIYNVLDLDSNFTLVLLQTIFGSAEGIGYLVVYLMIPQISQSFNFILSRKFNDTTQDSFPTLDSSIQTPNQTRDGQTKTIKLLSEEF
jgi:hypothetical protein